MFTMLVIATDPRAQQLLNRIEPLVSCPITVTDTLDHGMREFFQWRPAVVLIQQNLDEVSSKSFSVLVKTILPDEAPRIIFLRTAACRTSSLTSSDSVLDLSRPPEENAAELLRILAGMTGVEARLPAGMPEMFETPPPVSSDEKAFSETTDHIFEEAQSSDRPGKVDGEEVPGDEPGCLPELSYLVGIPAGREHSTRALSVTVAFAAILLAAGIFLTLESIKGKRHSGEPTTGRTRINSIDKVRATHAPPVVRLPSIVSTARPDPICVKEYPGWECYRTADLQIRLYRDKRGLRAVQVIEHGEGILSDSFFQSFFRELCGRSPSSPTGSVVRGDYVHESGQGKEAVEYLIYRRIDSLKIKAFVVSLP